MPHPATYGIVAVQSLFFFLGGIRDGSGKMTGRVFMPDEEYLQSWFLETKLGDSENHSARMVGRRRWSRAPCQPHTATHHRRKVPRPIY